jgi:uncharacterized membrane protein YjgN (DUF898 family)
MRARCPNCDNPVDSDAPKCDKCGALFDSAAAWKPIVTADEQRYPVEFTGAAGEYFRIWIVNLVLSILTLGIYSAWAKVRRRRYFYGHTRIDGDGFEYRGKPIPILKGRLIAVAAVAAFYGTSRFAPSLIWVLALVAVCAAPWLIVRSMAFNAHSTAYRNIRMRFRGTYPQCLGLLLWTGFILVVTFGLAYPYFKARLMEFLFRNHSYGTTAFEVPDLSYLGTYVRAAGLGLLFGIGVALLGFMLGALLGSGSKAGSSITTLAGYVGYLYVFCYIRAQIANATWNVVRIGKIRFECALRTDDLFVLYSGNILAIVATVGLATPWAVIRASRYRAQKMTVTAAGGLESFVAAESAEVSAAGEEIGEMFDFDLSL